ncbi:MAG: hypothetical protein ACUVX9_18890 [Anaerolineae bacterium]
MEPSGSCVNLVIGLGEIGRPLLGILCEKYRACGRDVSPIGHVGEVDVLHICYPSQIGDFVATTTAYIDEYRPRLAIIHSTVVPGTSRAVWQRAACPTAYSPVRGKHTRMREQLLEYTKYVAGATEAAGQRAAAHLQGAGFTVNVMSSCEALELAKLVETTYFGVLLGWAQEVERFCGALGVKYDEVMAFTEEVPYLPPVVFRPGYIGGHCVMPNADLLEQVRTSPFIDAMRESNEIKRQELILQGKDLNERIAPYPVKCR